MLAASSHCPLVVALRLPFHNHDEREFSLSRRQLRHSPMRLSKVFRQTDGTMEAFVFFRFAN
jgi:hypothetical protein